ncbi:MAG: hypothetical protein JWN94_3131 [Betaproteobacteria bacterium]|nr:hypothetical protein [Betaproteobacteria bacterium]
MEFVPYAGLIVLAAWLCMSASRQRPQPVRTRIYDNSSDAARHR